MNQYYFQLMGLNVTLETPFSIQISERLQPFASKAQIQTDCLIEINLAVPPQMTNRGYWHGPEYYENTLEYKRVFHCKTPFSEPFAVTETDSKGNIKITVHPEYADYFSGTSGIFNRIGFENLLLQHKGLLLHASLIEYAGRGVAFTGPSGVGKSTQADLWQRTFDAKILNGDRSALRKESSGWKAYGSPYAGTSGIYRNEHTPLRAIVALKQGQKNQLHRLNGAEAMRHIWPEISARRWDEEFVAEATTLCAQLLTDIPVYLLECLPDESAVLLLKEGLSL